MCAGSACEEHSAATPALAAVGWSSRCHGAPNAEYLHLSMPVVVAALSRLNTGYGAQSAPRAGAEAAAGAVPSGWLGRGWA
jgi:hypothetical protein